MHLPDWQLECEVPQYLPGILKAALIPFQSGPDWGGWDGISSVLLQEMPRGGLTSKMSNVFTSFSPAPRGGEQLLPPPEPHWWCILHIPALLPSFLISNPSLPRAHLHQDAAGPFPSHPRTSKGAPRNMICHMKYQLEMRLSALFIPCYQFQLCS